jgi:DNA polymerase III sliding clamp (beta) subunit (PCNA family)
MARAKKPAELAESPAATVVSAPRLKAGLDAVFHAVSSDFFRPVLAAVLFEDAMASLRLVAADNYRVAIYDVPLAGGGDAKFGSRRVLLPRPEVKVLRAVLSSLKSVVRLSLVVGPPLPVSGSTPTSKFRLRVDWGYGVIDLHLMEGTFPDYEKLMRPELAEPSVTLSGQYMAEAGKAFGKSIVLVEIGPDPLSPVIFRDGGPLTEIVMPVRPASYKPIGGTVDEQ